MAAMPDQPRVRRNEWHTLALPALLEHERWIAGQHGSDIRGEQLSNRLPPTVRRLASR